MTSSMSGSCTDRSATSYAETTAATTGAAELSAGKASHCLGPSTLRTVAPVVAAVVAAYDVADLSVQEPDIEDVIRELYSR